MQSPSAVSRYRWLRGSARSALAAVAGAGRRSSVRSCSRRATSRAAGPPPREACGCGIPPAGRSAAARQAAPAPEGPRSAASKGVGRRSHGFRSSFRDWAAEKTDHPREVIEAALAHVVQNKVEAAYAVGPVRASTETHGRLGRVSGERKRVSPERRWVEEEGRADRRGTAGGSGSGSGSGAGSWERPADTTLTPGTVP